MTLNGVMAVTLRYFTEFGKPAFQHVTASERKIESSRSLSHLLMSFLFVIAVFSVGCCE